VSKSILPVAFAVAFGISFSASAQTQSSGNFNPYTQGGAANPSGTDSFSGAPGVGASGRSGAQKPSTSDASDTGNDTDDDSLTRLKTSNSVGAGAMSRDEGELTAKQRRREKVLHVESTAKLPTSGTDPKFQGSLLHSSVTSINDVGDKANAEPEVLEEGDPRFKAKRLVFSPATEDESKTKKKESPGKKADTSPSPSPSATASATPSSH
jgi:hypothetical protein